MPPILAIHDLSKVYRSGHRALAGVDLEVEKGEIFALLGPNGAGKTTLINTVCGIVTPSSGRVEVGGFDIRRDFRRARALIGLVPQELAVDAFETVLATVRLSRGLYGKRWNPDHIEAVLRDLSLWDKRDEKVRALSGGMKRRVLIAKALSHEPSILFLDEPTAGVDVQLRRGMWRTVHRLREQGVTVILTTHYIEEAEQMADRIGVIDRGKIIVVEGKDELMRKLGKKQLLLSLRTPMPAIPAALSDLPLELVAEGAKLVYSYDNQEEDAPIAELLGRLHQHGIAFKDLHTRETSLEEIFVSLMAKPEAAR